VITVAAVVAVLVLGAGCAWWVARAGVPGVVPAVRTQPATSLPAGPVRSAQVHDVRLDQALRGYRMDQVDEVLARLADELATRDAEIDRLRALRPAGGPP
jgi:DivIVA domain-containing protein